MKEVLENWSDNMPSWLWNILITVISVIIGLIIKLIIKAILNFYKNRTDYSLFRSIIVHTGRPMNHFVPLLVLNLMLPLMDMQKRFYIPFSRFIEISLIISFAVLLVSSIKVFEDYMYHVYDLNKEDNLKERKIRTQLQFIRRIMVTFIVLIAVAVVLLSFDNVRKIGAGLLTGVGIGGIIIGFAAQKSLANFLAGFQIAFTQPLRIDDVLVVEGEWGRVEDITLTYVVLNIWDQRRLILPINYFIEKPFQNWTRTTSQILGTVFLYLDYNTPVDAIRTEFDRLLDQTNLWDKRVKVIQVTDAKEHTIEIRALMSARNSSQAFDLRCYIRENLIIFLRDNYPQSLPLQRVVLAHDETATKEPQSITG
ncbi:mechanosensitive ion channel family protein [Mucilaginibacter sp. UR6-1]|uniref:mechanosensitive ion channel family protein n=1 Tax=Mucilaginibacter sp. UR6-1 TaxID=1435643 RepID=UPI001E5FD853|nr:mechanosensitive ion channel domain-containing protein [Mucilaginibacter sp. UR6-1]MCC8410568.1 mechanosensitive ion channel family protein [Mucilaginibacter sp. UR6-1]